ncbi:MAG: hypothetical protein ACO1Q7_09390 [Gemmatimonas sp.]
MHMLHPMFLAAADNGAGSSLGWLQWPSMAVTVLASWFVTSRYKKHRWIGFALFLASNVLWTVWGLSTGAMALVVMQGCLFLLNLVGIKRADSVE